MDLARQPPALPAGGARPGHTDRVDWTPPAPPLRTPEIALRRFRADDAAAVAAACRDPDVTRFTFMSDGLSEADVICDANGRPVTPTEAKEIIAEHFTVPADVRARRRSKKVGKAPQQKLEAHVRSHTEGVDRRGDLPHPTSSTRSTDHVNRRTA